MGLVPFQDREEVASVSQDEGADMIHAKLTCSSESTGAVRGHTLRLGNARTAESHVDAGVAEASDHTHRYGCGFIAITVNYGRSRHEMTIDGGGIRIGFDTQGFTDDRR